MIKKFIAALVIALPMCVSAQKFGIVDPEAILPLMPQYQEADAKIAEVSKKYEAEFTKLREEQEKKYAEFQELNAQADTPQSIKERRMQEIQETDQKVQQFVQTAQQDLQRQQQQLMQPVQAALLDAIQAVGQEQGMTFIFPLGMDLYHGTDVQDLTPLVKAKLGLK